MPGQKREVFGGEQLGTRVSLQTTKNPRVVPSVTVLVFLFFY